MKKIIFVLAFVIMSGYIFGQKTVTAEYVAKLNCSQKYGLDTQDGNFLLTVIYDDTNLKFNSEKGQAMTEYSVVKKTDKYVIGKDQSGNYSFFNIEKKQFYYIDYFMSRYSTSGYGAGYSEIKQTVLKMMKMLKEGKTQKDVIQHLIEQASYDF